jgi:DNA repair protein RadC
MSDASSESKSAANGSDAQSLGTGHRARLRKRMAEGGGDALLDHELVEYILALAIPRRDTKPLAKALLSRFGGFGGLMTANWQELAQVKELGETSIAALKIAQATALRLLRTEITERPILSSWQALLDYLRADMAFLMVERVRVLHLNSRNMLLLDDHMGDGSIDEAAIYTREVVKRAITLGSASLILVHNHPSGLSEPSSQDIAVTRQIMDATRPLGVSVHDHIIIGSHGHSSMRAMGLI